MKGDTYDSGSDKSFDSKEYQTKNILNHHEFDLYDESKNLVEKVIRVKRVKSAANGERWKIFCDDKVVFIVDGKKLSKTEINFFRSHIGFLFLINQAKSGIKSLNQLRNSLKKEKVNNE